MNSVREKLIPRCKLSNKVLQEQDEYNPMIYISPYPISFLLKDSLGRIQHCVTFIGTWFFESNFPFALLLTQSDLDYDFINDNVTKGMNGYKLVLK